ncbi:dihydroorotase family protein [Candidatus Bathyarchaeota archaeon]|nr:dihydroorotase family protein [Candidatus Bathyarchaeota archaeon]
MVVDTVLKNLKAYLGNDVMECCLAIEDGRIFKIGKESNMPKANAEINLNGLLVLPGLIDVHVHLRDEGKAYKEDFYSGTAAAAAGGITTVLDMPNNAPVTMSVETLRSRMEKAEKDSLIVVGFYSAFPDDIKKIPEIMREGAFAFKLFLNEQIGGLNIDDDRALTEAFQTVASKIPVAVHAEDRSIVKNAEKVFKQKGQNDIAAFLEAHSEKAEVKAIKRIIAIARKTGAHVHVCHVSTANVLRMVADAKKSGLSLTCEVTPHHLFLSSEDLKRLGTLALTVPPLRERNHAESLWEGVKNGVVDAIASDHAPHTIEEKEASVVWDVKVGVPGLETTLPLLLTEVNAGRIGLADVVRLMAENPAKIFNLKGRGSLKEGNKADLVVVGLKRRHRLDASRFHSKAKYSPFDGKLVKGKPVKTFVGGRLVMDEGEIVAKAGCGEIIKGGA